MTGGGREVRVRLIARFADKKIQEESYVYD
jgi:hypothetical protein